MATNAASTGTQGPGAEAFPGVDRTGYSILTTFRKDGTPVPTQVWALRDGGRMLVTTDAKSGKAKRIRANGRATLAPCDRRGRPLGEAFPAMGRQLPKSDNPAITARFFARYGLLARLIFLSGRLRKMDQVMLELVPVAVAVAMSAPTDDDTGAPSQP